MGVYLNLFKARKKRTFGKFPESKVQTARDRYKFIEPKIVVLPPEKRIILFG